jgi:deazaflavin-dependent oxidoreductase (nitroreductase family)
MAERKLSSMDNRHNLGVGIRFQARLARMMNPLVLRLARFIPFFGVLNHRGRRSGRIYRTPLAAIRHGDGFVLPLAFGVEAGWFRNLSAAGSAQLQWRGKVYSVSDPVVVDWAEGSAALSPVQRRLAPAFGVKRFVRLRVNAKS